MKEIVIVKEQSGQRLDKFLGKYLSQASMGFIYKMLRKKNIKLNDGKADGREKLVPGDRISLYFSEETLLTFHPTSAPDPDVSLALAKKPLQILYEDDNILVLNKQRGLLSQKAKPADISLNELVAAYVGNSYEGVQAGICNRLDRNTSGIVVAGKTIPALQKMNELFRSRELEKYYLAVVYGRFQEEGEKVSYLKKDRKNNQVQVFSEPLEGAERIQTGFQVLKTETWKGGPVTLLKVRLYTGKSHQIRGQCQAMGHPIVGDPKYAKKEPGVKGQMLHSYELRFPPMDGDFQMLSERVFQAPPPDDLIQLIDMKGVRL